MQPSGLTGINLLLLLRTSYVLTRPAAHQARSWFLNHHRPPHRALCYICHVVKRTFIISITLREYTVAHYNLPFVNGRDGFARTTHSSKYLPCFAWRHAFLRCSHLSINSTWRGITSRFFVLTCGFCITGTTSPNHDTSSCRIPSWFRLKPSHPVPVIEQVNSNTLLLWPSFHL